MAEYIKRRDVSNACYDIFEEVVRKYKAMTAEEVKQTMLRFEKAIQLTPTADVVEVVRCRDCVFRVSISAGGYTYKGEAAKECVWHNRYCHEDDFCSSGIRKERSDT